MGSTVWDFWRFSRSCTERRVTHRALMEKLCCFSEPRPLGLTLKPNYTCSTNSSLFQSTEPSLFCQAWCFYMFYFETCNFFPSWWIGWIGEACLQFTWKHGNFAVMKHEGKSKIAPRRWPSYWFKTDIIEAVWQKHKHLRKERKKKNNPPPHGTDWIGYVFFFCLLLMMAAVCSADPLRCLSESYKQ